MELIRFSREHFDSLRSWFPTEADLTQWGGATLRFPLDTLQLTAMVESSLSEPPLRFCWMAKQDNHLIGHVQLGFDWHHGVALLGRVGIAPEMRGRGLAAPMLALVIDQAFSFHQIERLELHVYSFNRPAIRAYERQGFVFEGTRRASVRVGSQRWDTSMYGLLRNEYEFEKASVYPD